MNEDFEQFLKDKEKNIYEFAIVSNKDTEMTFSVSEFIISLEKDGEYFKVKTEEEFLENWVENVNKTKPKTLLECLKVFNSEYGILMEDSPLYNNEDVFELENDNNDIKFNDRIRFKEEDFNIDLFSYIFEFFTPFEILKFQRVSKKFYSIGETNLLWKKFCKEPLTKESWKYQYKFENESKFTWDLNSFSKNSNHDSSQGDFIELIDPKTIQVNYLECYSQVFLNPPITKGKYSIKIQASGKSDDHINIGVINENFDRSTCCCLNPLGMFDYYRDRSGRQCFIMDSQVTQSDITFSHKENSIMKMIIDADKKELSFNGLTFQINGNTFQFFVSKCNGGERDLVTYKILGGV